MPLPIMVEIPIKSVKYQPWIPIIHCIRQILTYIDTDILTDYRKPIPIIPIQIHCMAFLNLYWVILKVFSDFRKQLNYETKLHNIIYYMKAGNSCHFFPSPVS